MHKGFLVDLELLSYEEALLLQEKLHDLRKSGAIADTLILVEHPPVYTVGRSGGYEHLRAEVKSFASMGARIIETDRGGSITFHGLGQVVAYPVMHMERFGDDLLQYLRCLEELVIRVLGEYGISGKRFLPYTGVWVGNEKIAAIGVNCRASVATHGFALNVSTDLHYFDMINPCGITDYGVTSMAALLSEPPQIQKVKETVAEVFSDLFAINLKKITPETLFSAIAGEG